MPAAAMIPEINKLFVGPSLGELDPQAFLPGKSTADAIRALQLQDAPYVGAYVAAMPKAVVDAMLGAIFAALSDDPRSTVTLAWSEASHYAVTVSQTPKLLDAERGAVTIVLMGPLTP